MEKTVIDLLKKPLNVYDRPGPGGKDYKYVKGEDVIERLNEAFTYDWSSEIKEVINHDGYIVVHVKLTSQGISHEAFGGAGIAVFTYGDNKGKPVDIANSYKSALTAAIKKAGEQFGIGLNLDDYIDQGEQPDHSSPKKQPTKYTEPPKGAQPTTKAPPTQVVSKPAIVATVAVAPKVEVQKPAVEKAPDVSSSDLAAITKFVQDNMNELTAAASKVATPSPAPDKEAPGSVASLASSFMASQKKAAPAFVKSAGAKINDIQMGAINGMCKLRGISVTEVLVEVVGSEKASDINALTYDEGVKVINHLNEKKRLG